MYSSVNDSQYMVITDGIYRFMVHYHILLFYEQYNQTPLHLAAWRGHFDVATTLIQNGAEIDAKSSVS